MSLPQAVRVKIPSNYSTSGASFKSVDYKSTAIVETARQQHIKLLKSHLLPLTSLCLEPGYLAFSLELHGMYNRHIRISAKIDAYYPTGNKFDQTDKVDMSDSTLSKWLIYCDNNVLLAVAKIRICLEYRRKHHIDDMLDEYKLPDFAKYYPGGICGQDKEGSPVYYEFFGMLNLKDIMSASTKQDLINFKIYQHENIIQNLKKLSRRTATNIDTILVIVDMMSCTDDTLWNPALRAWAEIIEVLQDLYPGLVKEILVINVHFIYPEVYISLRPYLSKSTINLIKVMGQDYQRHLIKRIEKHELPAHFGGYKCDYNNNPLCIADLNWTTKIPQYLKFTNKRMEAHVNELTVPAGEKQIQEYHVIAQTSYLIWQFYEIGHPILFSIYHNTIDEHSVILAKILISNTRNHLGWQTCPSPGRYYLVFDNCMDYAHSAKLVYKIDITVEHSIINKLAPKVPIGHMINFNRPVNKIEDKLRHENLSKYKHHKS